MSIRPPPAPKRRQRACPGVSPGGRKCFKRALLAAKGTPAMAEHVIPHFHNDPGVPTIRIGVKEVMCTGARPPFDHPHIFIDMGGDSEGICPYCSTRFVYDASLGVHSIPADCELRGAV